MLSHNRLLELLHYDPSTGIFRRRRKDGRLSARPVGHCSHGYVQVGVAGRTYRAHRLAWFYVHGRWPISQIDHINRIRNDNRLTNLREASAPQNAWNAVRRPKSPMGIAPGVFLDGDFWVASITHNNRTITIGRFQDHEEAFEARRRAA